MSLGVAVNLKDLTIPALYSVNSLQNKKLVMVISHSNKPEQ